MNTYSFDFWVEDTEQELQGEPIKPLWSINYKNQEELLKWLDNAFTTLNERQRTRVHQMIKNLALYKGIQYWSQDRYASFKGQKKEEIDTVKVIVNELYELTEQRVAKLTRYKPAVTPIPATNEQSDKASAKVVKEVLDTISYINDIDSLLIQAQRNCSFFGEQPILVNWDKSRGRIVSWNDDRTPNYEGDVSFCLPLPWQVLYQPVMNREDCEWIIYTHYEHIEKVKKDYPKKAKYIEATEGANDFDIESLSTQDLRDHVRIFELWHRSNKYMPQGLYFKATDTVLLEKPRDIEYDRLDSSTWGNLPVELLTCIDIPGHFHGVSNYQIFAPLQSIINKAWTMANRNLMLVGHPKFLVEKNAEVNFESLGNDATIVEYQGPVPPQLVTASTLGPEIFAFIEKLSQRMQMLAGTHPVSTGSPPPGIKAGIAIRLLEDIENQRASNDIKKHNQLIVDLFRKALAVVGRFYKEEDNRLVNILGRDKEYLIESFEVSALNKPYDIRVEQSSSLPQTPAARIQTIMDLMQIPGFRQLLPDEQWADMLDLATPGKFYDAARAAVSMAEWENEEFVQGRISPEPREGEDLLVHWRIHSIFYQTKGFTQLSSKTQEDFKDHLRATEYLMWLHMTQNPMFAQQIMTLRNWPMLYVQPQGIIPPQQPIQPGSPVGQANAAQMSNQAQAMVPQQPLLPEQASAASQVAGG